MSLLTVCRSIYSDISSRIIASRLPKYCSARTLVSSVFPTPVGSERRSVVSCITHCQRDTYLTHSWCVHPGTYTANLQYTALTGGSDKQQRRDRPIGVL